MADYGLKYAPNAMYDMMGDYGLNAPGVTPVTPDVMGGVTGAPVSSTFQPSFWDKMAGYTDPSSKTQVNGMGVQGLQALTGIGNAWLGMQQYGLAKDSFKFQKDAYNQNYAMNKGLVNSQLEDRQRARVASNSGAYQSVGDYMSKNGVK